MALSDFGFDPHCRLLHRRGENTHFKVKTRVPEPFSTDRRSFLCTGAVKTHFVHRRGGFAKLCKTIAPVSENRVSAKLSKTMGNLTVLTEKVRQPRAELPLFFALSAPPAAEGQQRQLEPFRGASPGPSRAPPGAGCHKSTIRARTVHIEALF